jgi:hypothetical protein
MYTLEMNTRRITCDRETLISLIKIPSNLVRAIYTLPIGHTIYISGWNITRL